MAQKPKRGAGMPLPPAPPEGGPDDQDYVYMSPGEQQAVQPYYGLPLMTPEMRRYRVGGRQMMDPRNFEYIQRKREEARTQGTRLKKGGPVKKYQKGGAVEDGKDKYPSERRMLEKGLARTRQRRADMDTELDPTGDREAVMSAPFQVQRPSAFYPLTGRDYVGPRQQMDRERARREAEVQRRVDVARRSLDDRMSTMESSLSEMGTKENKQNYRKGGAVKKAAGGMVEIEIKVGGGGKRKGMHKMPDGSMMEDEEHEAEEYRKGGMVKPKAPVKKAMGGKVAAKPMGKPVMKKAGGRVAAKPMMKGRKK